jgi:hypothetical protein
MTTQSLDQPFVASTALRSVNFFNGRLLTGDDLSREQATQAARLARLGRTVGDGIAWGLEVVEQPALSSKSKPVVTVSAGIAVSRAGTVLELAAPLDVALYRDVAAAPAGAEPGNLFADCQPAAVGTYTAGAGVYVLTVAPQEQGEGRAQVNGLGNGDASCNVALEAEALAFRLIRLSVPPEQLAAKALLRNRIAYACFGTDTLAGGVADAFGPPVASYGLLDTLRTQTLSDDEVPLAVIGWSIDDGVEFVDLWSVRRRVTHRADEGDWTSLVSDRRSAEAESMFLQFQTHLADIRATETDTSTLIASERFELLPPVGLVPLVEGTGFDFENFFADVPHRDPPATIEGAHVVELVHDALAFPPIDLARDEAVWLYLVRENLQALAPVGDATAYLVFTSGHVRYRGDARFDLAYWNFASYAEIG